MIYDMIGILAGFFEVCILYILLNSCFEKKYESKIIYYIWIILDFLLIFTVNKFSKEIGHAILISMIFDIIVIKVLFEGHLLKIIFWITAYNSIVALADILVFILSTYAIKIDVSGAYEIGLFNSVATIISKIILWVVILKLSAVIGKTPGYEENKNFVPLLVVPVVSICAMFLILDYATNVSPKARNNTLIYITVFGMFFMNIVVFYIYERLYEMSVVKQEISLMEQQLIYQRKYFAQLEDSYQQIRGIKHDINRHINLISALAKKGECDKVLQYITELGASTNSIVEIVQTGNIILDAIINEKYCIARKLHINFQFEVEAIKEDIINPTSLCIIVSNVLDNAIEGCENLKNQKNPMIQLKLYMQKNNLVLSVENDAQEPKRDKGRILTNKVDKKSHGVGLKNVERVIEENHGYFDLGYQKGKFIFVSRIPLNCKYHYKTI